MAQWIRHLTTNQGIPGSSPGRVVYFFFNFYFYPSLLLSFTFLKVGTGKKDVRATEI